MRYRPPGIIDHLNGLMARHGWLRDEDLRAAAEVLGVPLHRVEGVASFYPLYRRSPPAAVTVHVCRDLSCSMRGGEEAIAQLTAAAAARERETGERHEVVRSSCLGRCDQAPACLVHHVPMDMESMRRTLVAAAASEPPAAEPCAPKRLACDPYAGAWGDRYATVRRIAEGGAAAADQVLAALADAGLRGMGGAGFPTARKWGFVRGASGDEKFVICNADESEPGTFKDRELLRSAPHLVWEGMMIAALVVGARRCITYIRHEYEPERANLERERARAQEVADALGITLEIFVSPGGYIQGEETAL
ncbi:MAG: NAD(P)H-dependent oxidoreductase subunit E, partial [Nannocystaceae bacterium]